MPSLSGTDGNHLLPHPGNAGLSSSRFLTDLPAWEYAGGVQAIDPGFGTSLFSVTKILTISTVGIRDLAVEQDRFRVHVFPYPIGKSFFLDFPQNQDGGIQLRWYSAQRQLKAVSSVTQPRCVNHQSVQCILKVIQPNLENGVYIVEIFSQTDQKILTLVKVLINN